MSLYDSAYRCKWLFMKSIHSSIRSVPKAVISDLFRDVRNASHHERESRDMIQRSDYFPTLYRFLTFVHWHSLCKICFLCLKDIDTFSDHQQRWCSVPRALIKCPFLLFLRLPVCFVFVLFFFLVVFHHLSVFLGFSRSSFEKDRQNLAYRSFGLSRRRQRRRL